MLKYIGKRIIGKCAIYLKWYINSMYLGLYMYVYFMAMFCSDYSFNCLEISKDKSEES